MVRPLRCLLLVLPLLLLRPPAQAQAPTQLPPARFGLGGQIGNPGGVSLKLYRSSRASYASRTSYSILAAWDLGESFFVHAHRLIERPLPDSPLNYVLGPGAVLGLEDRANTDLVLGLSALVGLNFFLEHFEVFLQITPRLLVIPRTQARLGGGIGLRYYF